MTLPDVCPMDGVSPCKKKACHLYVVEWRTGDEQCVIGYVSTHRQFTKKPPVEDTYAEKIRSRREEKDIPRRRPWNVETAGIPPKREHLKRRVPEQESVEVYIEANVGVSVRDVAGEADGSERNENVRVIDKDTTVIESKQNDEGTQKGKRKIKSLDEVLDAEFSEEYEKKFWK